MENLSFHELRKIAKEKGISSKGMSKEAIIRSLSSLEKVEIEDVDIDLNKINKVITSIKRGRPIDPDSPRQKRLAELVAKKEAGVLKRGRPIDPDSPRQKRLAAIEAKRKAGIPIKRGRPKNNEEIVINVSDIVNSLEIESATELVKQ